MAGKNGRSFDLMWRAAPRGWQLAIICASLASVLTVLSWVR